MKSHGLLLTLLMIGFCLSSFAQITSNIQQSTSINSSGIDPDSSAMLDIQSNSKGVLIPRMTEGQRNVIPNPANGLLIFQTDMADGFYFNEGSSSSPSWKHLAVSGAQTDTIKCETRTPIDSLPWLIDQPGSYYVTKNLVGLPNQNGITIMANNVHLDLNGFEIRSGGGTIGDGIFASGLSGNIDTNICVINGTIIGWSDEGVNANSARNSRFENLKVMNCQADGIYTGRDNIIIGCTAMNNGADGIDGDFSCLIKNCVAMNNGDNGIESGSGSVIINCTAYQNGNPDSGTGNGINVSPSCTVLDCSATDNYRFGFNISNGSIIKRCVASLNDNTGFFLSAAVMAEGNTSRVNDGHGFQASTDSYLKDNVSDQNDLSGIEITTSDIRLDGNHCTDNGQYGIRAAGTGGSLIIRNSCSGNVVGQYSILAGHHSGQIIVSPGVGFINSNPWANFEF